MATGRSSLPVWEVFDAFPVPHVIPQQLNINKPFWSVFDVGILKIRISEVSMLCNVSTLWMEQCTVSRACTEHVDMEGRQRATSKLIFSILWLLSVHEITCCPLPCCHQG